MCNAKLVIFVGEALTIARLSGQVITGVVGSPRYRGGVGHVDSVYEAGVFLSHLFIFERNLPEILVIISDSALELDGRSCSLQERYSQQSSHAFRQLFGGNRMVSAPFQNFLHGAGESRNAQKPYLWEDCESRGWAHGDPRNSYVNALLWFLFSLAPFYRSRVIACSEKVSEVVSGSIYRQDMSSLREEITEFFAR